MRKVVLWDGEHYINIELSNENLEAMHKALADDCEKHTHYTKLQDSYTCDKSFFLYDKCLYADDKFGEN